MSYILTLRNKPEGVFSVIDRDEQCHVIPIFEDSDDIERYQIQLIEAGETPALMIIQVPQEEIVSACVERNQKYVIITVDDFMIPPD